MITLVEYKERRASLSKMLPPHSVAIIPAAKLLLRNGDSHYRFRQDSDFLYYTGFEEPEAILLIFSSGLSYLFNAASNPAAEIWTGPILGQESAIKTLSVDNAFAIDKFSCMLPEILENIEAIFYPIGKDNELMEIIFNSWQKVENLVRKGSSAPEHYIDLAPLIARQRLFKSKNEISILQKAADISVCAHEKAMRICKNMQYEYEIEAELSYEFLKNSCRASAYDSIVAAGKNACILHYTQNNSPLRAGDLLLIDAGAEYQGYASDITRTFPISAKFSAEQKVLYELVLEAQKAAINFAKPGIAWEKLQQAIVYTLTTGMVELGLLKGNIDDLIEKGAYKEFYMHGSGHWLGLDVHDSGFYKQDNKSILLQEGMVFTIEPGIYISSLNVDKRWQGIGIRIEDDFVITDKDSYALTKALVKEVADIEDLLSE